MSLVGKAAAVTSAAAITFFLFLYKIFFEIAFVSLPLLLKGGANLLKGGNFLSIVFCNFSIERSSALCCLSAAAVALLFVNTFPFLLKGGANFFSALAIILPFPAFIIPPALRWPIL